MLNVNLPTLKLKHREKLLNRKKEGVEVWGGGGVNRLIVCFVMRENDLIITDELNESANNNDVL